MIIPNDVVLSLAKDRMILIHSVEEVDSILESFLKIWSKKNPPRSIHTSSAKRLKRKMEKLEKNFSQELVMNLGYELGSVCHRASFRKMVTKSFKR